MTGRHPATGSCAAVTGMCVTMEGMLLEREAQLAALADYAREASSGTGRLVLVAGEAGIGKSALVEQLQRGPARRPLVAGGRATACSPRGRSARCSTSPRSSAASCSSCAGRRAARRAVRAPCCARSASRRAARGGHRGRALGRRGHPRPAALPRPAAPGRAGRCCVATYRDDGLAADRPAPDRPGRAGHPAADPADRARRRCRADAVADAGRAAAGSTRPSCTG